MTTTEQDILYLYLLYRIYKRHKRRRRVWVNPANKEREKYGILPIYPRIVDDVEEFYVYTKMSPEIFDDLCTIVSPEIRKMDTNFREAIPPRERLLMTLRFLSSGESLRSLSYHFRIGTSTIRQIVYETCEAIWKRCQAREIPQLEEADFKRLGAEFRHRWEFPNCVGCIVGKRIRINSTSQRWNGSGPKPKTERRSLILQGVTDAHGNFVALDVGDFEREGEAGPSIFRLTPFGKALMNNKLDLPPSEAVDGSDDHLPYAFITSINYPMLSRLLRPFPKRDLTLKRKLFNEKLSHAYKCSELAFGALVDRWCVLKSAMNLDPAQVCKIVRACCILHNFVRHRMTCEEDPEDVLDILPPVTKSLMGRPCIDAIEAREHFADYFYRTQPTPSLRTGLGEAHEPLLELECQEDETTPMEEQDYNYNDQEEDQFHELDYSDEKATEDSKMDVCLNLDQTKPENNDHIQLETDDHGNEKLMLRNLLQSSGSEHLDIGEPPHPVLQYPAAVQPPVEGDQEVDVKPNLIYSVKML